MFNDEQKQLLAAPLQRANVKSRKGGGGRSLSYIEGWHAIVEANRIFGFDGWSSETTALDKLLDYIDDKNRHTITFSATVTIRVGDIVRQGYGAGHGRDFDHGTAMESALKEAETDARKRALMTFGNQFGLALYDKDQTNVEGSAPMSAPNAKRKHPNSAALNAVVEKYETGVMAKAMKYAKEVPVEEIPTAEAYVRAHKELNTLQRAELIKILNQRKPAAV